MTLESLRKHLLRTETALRAYLAQHGTMNDACTYTPHPLAPRGVGDLAELLRTTAAAQLIIDEMTCQDTAPQPRTA